MPDGTWGGGVDMAGRGRHYKGKPVSAVTTWKCPSCGADNLSDLAKGCPVCGAGTAQQAAAAVEKAKAEAEAQVSQLDSYVVKDASEVQATFWVMLEGYTEAARQTIAHALEHYTAHGMREEGDLPSVIQIAWARRLLGLDLGEGPVGEGTGPGASAPAASSPAPGTISDADGRQHGHGYDTDANTDDDPDTGPDDWITG